MIIIINFLSIYCIPRTSRNLRKIIIIIIFKSIKFKIATTRLQMSRKSVIVSVPSACDTQR